MDASSAAAVAATAPTRNSQEVSGFVQADPDSILPPSESPYYAAASLTAENDLLSVNNDRERGRLSRFCRWLQTIDGMVAGAFFCNVTARVLPVLLVPIAVEEEVIEQSSFGSSSDDDNLDSTMTKQIASLVAHITSMAFCGGAIGKFVNGFVCQQLGTHLSSTCYLTGLALCSLLFSLSHNANTMGTAYAGIEFFSSIQYGSLALMLSQHYENDRANLASALTALGLASTLGEIVAKTAGSRLAGAHHWRIVAKGGAAVAFVGAAVIAWALRRTQHAEGMLSTRQTTSVLSSILKAQHSMLASRQFWILAFAYSVAFVCACVDRILVSFYYDMTHLPHSICGGLTLSVTVGLVHGLIVGSKRYTTLETVAQKMSFLRNRYMGNVASALGLALISYYGPIYIFNDATIHSSLVVAVGIFVVSAAMSSAVAFQYFQLPSIIAQDFVDNRAVCIMWLEGTGYLFSIPTYRFLAFVVPQHGWSLGWGMLSVIFAIGGFVMLCFIRPTLETSCFYDEDDQKNQQDPWRFFDWAKNMYGTVVADRLCQGGEFMAKRYMPEASSHDLPLYPSQPPKRNQSSGMPAGGLT